MRVVLIPLTYPLHYERLLTFTTFPAWNMLHWTQWPPHLTVHHKPLLDQCTGAYPLALQTTTLQTALQYPQTAQMMMKKKISRWYPWMMNTGLLKKHLKELFVSMNMDYCMAYANTHVLMRTITLFHTWTVWISVTFLTMRITWLPPAMKKYWEWKKYHTSIEPWFAWTFVLT